MSASESIPPTVSRGALHFGFLGGAIAWTLHLLLAYLIAEFGCETEADEVVAVGITLPAWLLLGQSLVMFLVAMAATVTALRARRRLGPPQQHDLPGQAAAIYLARSGVIASGLFAFIILVQSLPIFFYLRSC